MGSASCGCLATLRVSLKQMQLIKCWAQGSWRAGGGPRGSWLQQMDRCCQELGMGRISAWDIACRRPEEYRPCDPCRRNLDAFTDCVWVGSPRLGIEPGSVGVVAVHATTQPCLHTGKGNERACARGRVAAVPIGVSLAIGLQAIGIHTHTHVPRRR